MPICSAPRISSSSSAVCSSTLVGMQPTCRQVPPTFSRSTIAVRWPSCVARIAPTYPAGPPPIPTRSNASTTRSPPSRVVRCRLAGGDEVGDGDPPGADIGLGHDRGNQGKTSTPPGLRPSGRRRPLGRAARQTEARSRRLGAEGRPRPPTTPASERVERPTRARAPTSGGGRSETDRPRGPARHVRSRNGVPPRRIAALRRFVEAVPEGDRRLAQAPAQIDGGAPAGPEREVDEAELHVAQDAPDPVELCGDRGETRGQRVQLALLLAERTEDRVAPAEPLPEQVDLGLLDDGLVAGPPESLEYPGEPGQERGGLLQGEVACRQADPLPDAAQTADPALRDGAASPRVSPSDGRGAPPRRSGR